MLPATAAADEGGFGVRFVNVAAGQLGPIAKNDTRTQVVARLSDLISFYDPSLEIVTFPAWGSYRRATR